MQTNLFKHICANIFLLTYLFKWICPLYQEQEGWRMQGLGAWNQQGSLSSSGRDADLRSSWLQHNKNLLSSLRGQRKSSQVSCFPQYYFSFPNFLHPGTSPKPRCSIDCSRTFSTTRTSSFPLGKSDEMVIVLVNINRNYVEATLAGSDVFMYLSGPCPTPWKMEEFYHFEEQILNSDIQIR